MLKKDLASPVMSKEKHKTITLIYDTAFMKWLSNKLGYKPCRLHHLLRSTTESYVWQARNVLPPEKHQEIYDFWKENTVVSVDRRNGRDKVRIPKMKYVKSQFMNIKDEDLKEEVQVLSKSKGTKKYISAQRLVQGDSVDKLFELFRKKVGYEVSIF